MERQQISPLLLKKQFLDMVAASFEQTYDRKAGLDAEYTMSDNSDSEEKPSTSTFLTENRHKLRLLKKRKVHLPISREELLQYMTDLEEWNLNLIKSLEEDQVELEDIYAQDSGKGNLIKDIVQTDRNLAQIEALIADKKAKLNKMQN